MAENLSDNHTLLRELRTLEDPMTRLSADLQVRHLVERIARRISEEHDAAFSLWSWLPSYAVAKKEYGDYAAEFMPPITEVMREAAIEIARETSDSGPVAPGPVTMMLWSTLPSYREALKYHADDVAAVAPYPEDTMKEACMVLGDRKYPDLHEDRRDERELWHTCPCGESHEHDEARE